MGLRPAALLAGYSPKKIPIAAEKPKASVIDSGDTTVEITLDAFTSAEIAIPIAIPMMPPRIDSTSVSVKNWYKTSRCR